MSRFLRALAVGGGLLAALGLLLNHDRIEGQKVWEMIVCAAVAWGGSCQEQRPVIYPSRDFCERAIPAVKAANPKISAIYCRPKA